MSEFAGTLRGYIVDLLEGTEEINEKTVAQDFIGEFPELVTEESERLITNQVHDLIKKLMNQRPEDSGQLALFPGLSRGIRIRPGVIKPLGACTLEDLRAGRAAKIENIANAEKELAMYDNDVDKLRPLLIRDPELTVDDVKDELLP